MRVPLSVRTVRAHFQRKHNPHNPIYSSEHNPHYYSEKEVSFDSKILFTCIGCHRQNYFSGSKTSKTWLSKRVKTRRESHIFTFIVCISDELHTILFFVVLGLLQISVKLFATETWKFASVCKLPRTAKYLIRGTRHCYYFILKNTAEICQPPLKF